MDTGRRQLTRVASTEPRSNRSATRPLHSGAGGARCAWPMQDARVATHAHASAIADITARTTDGTLGEFDRDVFQDEPVEPRQNLGAGEEKVRVTFNLARRCDRGGRP